MSWGWVYVRARLVPLAGSLLLVGVVNGIAPLALPMWLVGSVAVGIVGIRTSAWRVVAGARRPTGEECEVIRTALGMVPGLRGRSEPTGWVCGDPRLIVRVPRPKEVLVSAGWVRTIEQGGATVDSLAAEVAADRGRGVTRRTWTAIVDAACGPAWIVMAPLSWLGRRLPSLRLMFSAWLVLASVIAVVQQASAQRWAVVASVGGFTTAALVAPRWSRRWRREVDRLGTDAVRAAGLADSHPHGSQAAPQPGGSR